MLTMTELNNKLNKQGYELEKDDIVNKVYRLDIINQETKEKMGFINMDSKFCGTYETKIKDSYIIQLLNEFCNEVKAFYQTNEKKYLRVLKKEYFEEGVRFYKEDNTTSDNIKRLYFTGFESSPFIEDALFFCCHSDTELKERGYNIKELNKYFRKVKAVYYLDEKIYDILK